MNVANKLHSKSLLADVCVLINITEFNCIEPPDHCIAHLVRLTAKVQIRLILMVELIDVKCINREPV